MYGADGYNIINDTTSYPSYASVTVSGQTAYTWASSTSDVRALQKPASSTDRIAACWYSATNFTIDINLTDNNTHQVAVYALDWDGANTRSSRMEVLDAVTNEVLDSREVTSYSNGKYFVWQLKGHVKLRISHVSPAGANAVISGLFFDSRRNVALAANGATASASSTYTGYPFTPAAVIDGDRKGTNWLSGGGWNDAAPANTFPDWLEIDFSGTKTINEVDVFTVQDNYASPSEPTESMVFSIYGLTGYEVQSWTGSAWQTIPGASITGNNKVWRKIIFSKIATSRIRVLTNASADGYSRLTEVEAWESPSGSRVQWLVTDQLGTPRIILDHTGSLANVKRHDYLPFGEELFAPTSGRSTAQGYASGDGVRQQFTAKERDIETGLDYLLARYYSSIQGRFTSPDEFTGGARELYVLGSGDPEKQALAYADIFSPQSLNKYQYCLNNPLRYIDPDGHDYRIVEETDKEGKKVKRYVWDRDYTYKKGDKNGAPSNARYVDSKGRAIQLWGDNNKDLKKGIDHGYQVVEPTKEGFERYVNQSGDAPTSYVSYDDTKNAVLAAGYNQHYLDIHPDHWGGEDFSKPTSPTLHITLFPQDRIGDSSRTLPAMVTGHLPLKDATFHGEKHTQAGTWSDLGSHLKDAAKQTVGLKP